MAEKWLIEDLETSDLLTAVDDLDSIREILADGPNCEPPQVRCDLLKLHGMAMEARNQTGTANRELFDFAMDIESDIDEIRDSAERILEVLHQITEAEYEEGFGDEQDEGE